MDGMNAYEDRIDILALNKNSHLFQKRIWLTLSKLLISHTQKYQPIIHYHMKLITTNK